MKMAKLHREAKAANPDADEREESRHMGKLRKIIKGRKRHHRGR